MLGVNANDMTRRILSQHFEQSLERLKTFSQHARLAEHSDNLGLAREGFIKTFLKENLPSLIDFRSGEILDQNDKRSGQIDIILQSALSPRIHLFGDVQVALADFVLGAIEVKSTLTTAAVDNASHLKLALDTFRDVKSLTRDYKITAVKSGRMIELPNTPCFLFAYIGPTKNTLLTKLNEYGDYNDLTPKEYWPEVIVVLDREYNVFRNDGWLYDKENELVYSTYDGKECLVDMFVYICQIIEAWNAKSHHSNFGKFFCKLDPTA